MNEKVELLRLQHLRLPKVVETLRVVDLGDVTSAQPLVRGHPGAIRTLRLAVGVVIVDVAEPHEDANLLLRVGLDLLVPQLGGERALGRLTGRLQECLAVREVLVEAGACDFEVAQEVLLSLFVIAATGQQLGVVEVGLLRSVLHLDELRQERERGGVVRLALLLELHPVLGQLVATTVAQVDRGQALRGHERFHVIAVAERAMGDREDERGLPLTHRLAPHLECVGLDGPVPQLAHRRFRGLQVVPTAPDVAEVDAQAPHVVVTRGHPELGHPVVRLLRELAHPLVLGLGVVAALEVLLRVLAVVAAVE